MKQILQSLYNKTKQFIQYAYISFNKGDSTANPLTQVSFLGDNAANAQRISPYGLFSNPPVGTKVVLFQISAATENKACIPFCQAERISGLEPGEVAVGSAISGSYIIFKVNGDINIISKGNINLTATGNVNISGVKINTNGVTNLGSGGSAIARVGDTVKVGSETGTITSGGGNTSI
jgi:phage gp45-like